MLNKKYPTIDFMKNTLISTLEELIVLLDAEYKYMEDLLNDHTDVLDLIVNEKKVLASKYADYCKQVHDLSDPDKIELSQFAQEHQALLDDFSSKLNRNSEIIEARCKRSQLRIDSALNAIRQNEDSKKGYNASGMPASNVFPLRRELTTSVVS